MDKPRIFLGSSGKQQKLLQALTRGLEDIAEVEPWTTSFNPGTTTIERLFKLAHEVDFAAFVFAQDDWTSALPESGGQASPRDNVVFERSRGRILHHSFGRRFRTQRADIGHLFTCRPAGHEHPRRTRQPAARRLDRRTASHWKSMSDA